MAEESKQNIKEDKKSDKKTEKKLETEKRAIVNGKDLPVSIKYSVALCNFIRGKEIDNAIELLEKVSKMKIAIPMKGEIAHKRGMMSGKYPVKGAEIYIRLLKSLKSNAIANELELEKYRIHGIPNVAPRPYKRFGSGKMKRSHVTIKLIPIKTMEKKK